MINIKTMMRNHHFTRKKMVKLRENHINSQETYQQTKKKIVNNRSKHLV